MSIEAITALAPAAVTGATAQTQTGAAFSTVLDQLSGLNTQLSGVEQQVQQLALGQTDNLHQVMIGLEEARLQFDLVLQVRNKLLEAYQEMMRMQV
jgi:flagellar hook-basal body complex protein FliE